MADYIQDLKDSRAWVRREAERAAASFGDAEVRDGVARWRSNGAVPPADMCELWAHLGKPFDLGRTLAARAADVDAFLAEYRRNWSPPSGQALAEMRAEGVVGEVVDVAAGRRFRVPA